jgi:hypothetical protein
MFETLRALFSARKMNADPDQQQFARLLIAATEGAKGRVELINWLIKQPWAGYGANTRARVAHALSIVKVATAPETYAKAREIANQIRMDSYRLG